MTTEQQATLCYILKNDEVLLIRKKRGIGAGKINGPGGKVDPGETPLDAAVRETREEVGVTPLNLELRGELRFHFAGGPIVHCLIYVSREFDGELCETAEAIPGWYPVGQLPYREMWADDQHWLPLLLAGKRFPRHGQGGRRRISRPGNRGASRGGLSRAASLEAGKYGAVA